MVHDDDNEILGHLTPFNNLCLSCQWDPVTLVAFYFTANNAFPFHKLQFYLQNIQCLDFAHCFVKEYKTRLTYNCAHLRSTKESDSVKKIFVRKSFCVKIFLGENLLGEHFLSEHFFLGEHFFE